MQQEEEQHFIDELKQFVTENFPLSRMSNEELEENIEALVSERLGATDLQFYSWFWVIGYNFDR